MESQTVEIGDQEVQIAETEDGFEATAVEDTADQSGLYLRAEAKKDQYGFEVPLGADIRIEPYDGHNDYHIEWHDEDNVADLHSWSADFPGYDSGAYVGTPEIVEYEQ